MPQNNFGHNDAVSFFPQNCNIYERTYACERTRGSVSSGMKICLKEFGDLG